MALNKGTFWKRGMFAVMGWESGCCILYLLTSQLKS